MTTGQDETSVALDSFGDEHSEFRNFVCWHPDRVGLVMDTEALQTDAEVFLATHSPLPMLRGDVTDSADVRPYDEQAFLIDFLAPRDFAFVAVLGGAGTGKSHLIRWLWTRVKANDKRQVLLIPRAGTNLHEVLRQILERVEGERFDEYRRRLSETSTAMSVHDARSLLLDNLARVVESSGRDGDGALTEEQAYLSAELPHLLRDPVFRPYFLRGGGVLDRLASHVVGAGGVERVEERRVFGVSDLPSRFQDVNRASRLAQDIYRNLSGNDQLREMAARWLTEHIDEAVTQLMRMSGTDLLRLMLDVRAELARQGMELVILIEDLATLQGIDQQLLEALIIRPRQEGMPELCALRTAVAMTTGYYEGLKKNVRQRFDFRVVMGESDARGTATHTDVERFTARYLNASRLSQAELEEWYGGVRIPSEPTEHAPNACERCPFRRPCHKGFGAHDGMGLYPFSPVAIATITRRVSNEGFNPRTQLKEGYKPILENNAAALRDGRFPPPELGTRLGGPKLSPLVASELPRRDHANHARRAVLLDIWTNARELRNLDPVVHRAFDLPSLALDTVRDEAVPEPPTPRGAAGREARTVAPAPERTAASPAEARLARQLRELDEWSANGSMSQDLMQDLREVVYAAVIEHIDWNSLHLIPGAFSGQKGFRRSNSINFARQVLAKARASVELLIPLRDDDLPDATLALQGLLNLKHHKSWRFENGGRYYRAYLRQVNAWAQHVRGQVNRITDSGGTWDPVPASVELLSMGARVMGYPRARDPGRAQLLDALFTDLPDRDESGRSTQWQEMLRSVRKYQEKVKDVLLSRVACSKGDSRQIQIIDAARVLTTATEIARSSRPSQAVPADLEKSSRFLREYREAFDARLDEAVRDERAYQLARYESVAKHLDADGSDPEDAVVRRRETIAAARRAVESAATAGVLMGVQRSSLDEKLDEFDAVQFQAWAESIVRIRAEEEGARLLAELSVVPANTARVSVEFLDLVTRMLDATERSVQADVTEGERDGMDELQRIQDEIGAGLESLERELAMLSVTEEK